MKISYNSQDKNPRYRYWKKLPYDQDNIDKNGYCHSHGYRVVIGHSSSTCKKKLPGHQDSETRENTMNGSTKNSDWVFRPAPSST